MVDKNDANSKHVAFEYFLTLLRKIQYDTSIREV